MGPFEKGDKVVFKLDNNNERKVFTVRWCNSCGDMTLEERGETFVYSQFILTEEYMHPVYKTLFKCLKEPSSFKDFLSPMCRVEMRNGNVAVHFNGKIVDSNGVNIGHVSNRLDNGKHEYYMRCPANTLLEIVRVFAPPVDVRGILSLERVGELLWECPEIASERKEKENKAKLEQEYRVAREQWYKSHEATVEYLVAMQKLEKQLKEIE